MTYTKRVWYSSHAGEDAAPTAKDMGKIDNTLFDQDARITALEVLAADLLARVIVLEEA